jgi:hypothetical protein
MGSELLAILDYENEGAALFSVGEPPTDKESPCHLLCFQARPQRIRDWDA